MKIYDFEQDYFEIDDDSLFFDEKYLQTKLKTILKDEELDKIAKDEVYRELEKFNIEDIESFLRKKKMEKIGKKK